MLILTDESRKDENRNWLVDKLIGIFLEEVKMKLKNFILLGVFLLGLLVCGNSSVVLAKEDGIEECDAVTVEQARAITASATFLSK